jgi:HlyD family secretion protein
VNIRLDNFPHLEYGILEGVITSLSLVPVTTVEGGFYTAEVSIDQGLVTNYKKKLPFSEEMQGEAGIITSDRRLLSRLVAPLVSLVHERMLTN